MGLALSKTQEPSGCYGRKRNWLNQKIFEFLSCPFNDGNGCGLGSYSLGFFFFLALSQLCDILTKSLAPLVFTVHICTMSQLVQVRFSIYHNYKILNSMKTQIHSRYGIWLSSGQLRVALWKKRFFSVTWRGNLLPTLSRSTEFGFTYKIRRFVIIFNEQRTVRNGSYIVSSRRH